VRVRRARLGERAGGPEVVKQRRKERCSAIPRRRLATPALARAEHLVGFSIRRAGGRSGARPRSRTAAALSGSPRHGVSIAGADPLQPASDLLGSRSRAWRRMRAKCRASGPSGRGRPARRAAGRSPCPRLFRRRVAFGVGAEFTALAVHVDAPLGAFFPEPRGSEFLPR